MEQDQDAHVIAYYIHHHHEYLQYELSHTQFLIDYYNLQH